MQGQRKKIVSKAQYRLFSGALRRIQRGEPSGVDLTEDELFAALQDVDFEALPERAGRAAPKPRPEPVSQPAPRPQPVPPPPPPQLEPTGEPAPILSMAAYLNRFPEKRRRVLSSEVAAEMYPALFKTVGKHRAQELRPVLVLPVCAA